MNTPTNSAKLRNTFGRSGSDDYFPVIPIFAPFVRKAQSRGIEVIGEIELGYRYCSRGTHFVCIGGTNGKTTTTALTGEIFKANGEGQTFVLGNIGIPITEHASETRPGDTVVAETASAPARKHP